MRVRGRLTAQAAIDDDDPLLRRRLRQDLDLGTADRVKYDASALATRELLNDRDAERCLKLFTFLPLEEIAGLMAAQAADAGRRPAQRRLAAEVTSRVHGEATTRRVEAASAVLFGGTDIRGAEPGVFEVLGREIPCARVSGVPCARAPARWTCWSPPGWRPPRERPAADCRGGASPSMARR